MLSFLHKLLIHRLFFRSMQLENKKAHPTKENLYKISMLSQEISLKEFVA